MPRILAPRADSSSCSMAGELSSNQLRRFSAALLPSSRGGAECRPAYQSVFDTPTVKTAPVAMNVRSEIVCGRRD
jgi:hypothetical protein